MLEPLSTPLTEQKRYALIYLAQHLYNAQEWYSLFTLLDNGTYGRAKIEFDPSTALYAQDLDLGCRAAASPTWTFDQSLAHLPILWRYALLRCSLAGHADQYSVEAFQVLLALGQETKAIGLAELLTSAYHKGEVLLLIAKHIAKQPGRKAESQQIFLQANQVIADIKDVKARVTALRGLGLALAQTNQEEEAEVIWREAEAMIGRITDAEDRAEALAGLGLVLAQIGQWERAEVMIGQIKYTRGKENALSKLSLVLAQAGQWEWAESVIGQITDARIREKH